MRFTQAFVVLLAFSTITHAQVIHVPTDQPSIQEGLNAASFGDTVLVAPGTYFENIVWPSVNGIKLIAEGDTSDTFVDGSETERVFHIQGHIIDTMTLIEGFTITNGRGIGTPNASGVFCDSSSVIIRECRIMENVGQTGVGLGLVRSSTQLHRCSIEKNYGTCPNPSGIGIFVFDSSFVSIDSCEVVNNQTYSCVDINGVGIYISKHSTVSISNSNISSNKGEVAFNYGEFNGIGIFSYFSSNLYVFNSSISNNQAVGIPQTALGTALAVQNGIETQLDSVVISNNQTDATSEWTKGTVYCGSNSAEFNNVLLHSNTIKHTGTQELSTALIEIFGDFTGKNLRVEDNIIDFQSSQADIVGGLIRYSGASNRNNFSLENSLVADNTTINSQPGNSINGVVTIQNGIARMVNTTIANNLEGLEENAISTTVDIDTSNLSIVNSILWNPEIAAELTSTNIDVSHSDIQGGYAGFNSIDANPMFIGNGDYRLQTFSPCINSGTIATAPITDIEGNPRPMPVGTNPDMGAYEDDNPSTAISEKQEQEVALYPNPSRGIVTLANDRETDITEVRIFDASGVLVHQEHVSLSHHVLDLTELASGLYAVRLLGQTSVTNIKLQVIR